MTSIYELRFTMSALLALAFAGCAVPAGNQSKVESPTTKVRMSAAGVIAPPAPIPLLLPDPNDKGHWFVQWPDGADAEIYTWSLQTSTDSDSWTDTEFTFDDAGNWYVKGPAPTFFMRLRGITNQ